MLFLAHMDPSSKFMKGAESEKSDQVAGRSLAIAHGNVLGGGSTVNMMTYSRPYRFDFETWEVPGWSSEDVIPYFRKVSLPKSARGFCILIDP
jgi:choline dehydrogenase-like flavoprotein